MYMEELMMRSGQKAIFMIGNKKDMRNAGISLIQYSEGSGLANALGFKFSEISVKTMVGVDQLMDLVCSGIDRSKSVSKGWGQKSSHNRAISLPPIKTFIGKFKTMMRKSSNGKLSIENLRPGTNTSHSSKRNVIDF